MATHKGKDDVTRRLVDTIASILVQNAKELNEQLKEAGTSGDGEEPMDSEQTSAEHSVILERIVTETISDITKQANGVNTSEGGKDENETAVAEQSEKTEDVLTDDVIVGDVEETKKGTDDVIVEETKKGTDDVVVEETKKGTDDVIVGDVEETKKGTDDVIVEDVEKGTDDVTVVDVEETKKGTDDVIVEDVEKGTDDVIVGDVEETKKGTDDVIVQEETKKGTDDVIVVDEEETKKDVGASTD